MGEGGFLKRKLTSDRFLFFTSKEHAMRISIYENMPLLFRTKDLKTSNTINMSGFLG
jgi:hypothetical protein